MATTIPDGYSDLFERPVVGVLATVSPDGVPNASPMWFIWQDGLLRFTHTSTRKKYRNLQANPNFSFVVTDPDNPYRYLEAHGQLESVEEDPAGAFFVLLGQRYGNPDTEPPADSADRVILNLRPEQFTRK
ncbi:PPOX class F420-dependent oxidoreductase [Williamsia sterculiae]|nr:PPOX class F420-dependent oxidoreductase [Williamsia sterculiae]